MSEHGPRRPRVLHAALMSTFVPGIYQQMAWEAEATAAEGLPWDTRIFTSLQHPDPAGIMVPWRASPAQERLKLRRWVSFRRAYYAWISRLAEDYDVLMLRSHPYDPLAATTMRRLVGTVASVHHTFAVPELRTHERRLKGSLLTLAEIPLGRRNIRAVDLVIGVTPEIAEHESGRVPTPRPTLVYPNGAILDGELADRRGAVPELLFASGAFRPWHGLGLLLQSLQTNDADFTLHVAGQVDAVVASGCSDPRVVFHGHLSEADLRELSARAWVGISSLGLHHHHMVGSPLKVRGYLAQGVPVYGGHPDVFPAESRVYRVGEPDITGILDLAHELRAVSRERIRAEAEPHIDKRILVRDLYTSLSNFTREQAQVK